MNLTNYYPNPDFEVLYITKDTFNEIDLTEEFRPYFTYGKELIVTWEEFLKRIHDYVHKDGKKYFGMFKITTPPRTGLYGKYASTWHVYCPDDHTLKAEIYKLYTSKEDEEDGTKKENGGDKNGSGESTETEESETDS